MNMEIQYEQIMERGVKLCQITELHALPEYELPVEYLGNYKSVYISGSQSNVFYFKMDKNSHYIDGRDNITIGDKISPEAMKSIIYFCRICGNRLHEINKKIKKDKAAWCGKSVRVII